MVGRRLPLADLLVGFFEPVICLSLISLDLIELPEEATIFGTDFFLVNSCMFRLALVL